MTTNARSGILLDGGSSIATTHAYGSIDRTTTAETSSDLMTFLKHHNIPLIPRLLNTLPGKTRSIKDLGRTERLYVTLALISLLVTIGFTVFRIYDISRISTNTPEFIFAVVILLSSFFCLFYMLHGVFFERAPEMLIFSVAHTLEVVYLIINYVAGLQDNKKLARMIIASVFYLPVIILGLWISKTYYQSGKLIFRTVGADSKLQRMCQIVFIFFDTLTFDFQLAVTMVTLILVPGHIDVEEIILLSLGVILCIGWLILGCYSMRYEHKNCAILFLVSSFVEVGYVIYKLVKTRSDMRDNSGVAGFVGLAEGILICGACALLVRVIVFIFAILAVRNFKNGLKEKAFGIRESGSESLEISA